MFIVYNDTNYKLGKAHYIDKNATYTILDEDTKEVSTLSGSSLRARLKREIDSKSFTFKNVSYESRPILYQDIALEKEQNDRVVIDIQTGVVEGSITDVDIRCKPIEDNKGYITVNDLVLSLDVLNLPVYDSNYRFKPYNLLLANDIQVKVNEDCILRGIVLNKPVISQMVVEFNLVFNIFNSVYFSYEINSVEIHVFVDLERHLLIVDDREIALPTLEEYEQREIDAKVAEFKFSKFSKLSNYYDCEVVYDGRIYLSSEAAYQSMKTMYSTLRDKFSSLTPDEAKALGKQIESSSASRSDWGTAKFSVMHDIVLAKFSQNQDCKDELFRTKGFDLVEDTTGWHDRVWGRCSCEKCNGVGENHLGEILTSVRKELGCDE